MEPIIITFWHWLILAILLLGIELLTGTAVFLWLAAACVGVAGIVAYSPGLAFEYQLAWASIMTILSIVLWYVSRRFFPVSVDANNSSLNKRSEQYIGRTFTLSEAIINGSGKIKVDDSSWRVNGDDAPINSKVKVISAKGTVLQVATEVILPHA